MSATDAFEDGNLKFWLSNIITDPILTQIGSGILATVTPGSLFLALFSADPGEAGSTTSEWGDGNYTRQAIARDGGTSWDHAVSGQATNQLTIDMTGGAGAASPISPSLTFGALMTQVSGGTMVVKGPLASPVSGVAGTQVVFNPGSVTMTVA